MSVSLKILRIAVLAGCSVALCGLQAAPLPGDRDLARERQQRLLQEQQQRLDELQSLPGALPDAGAVTASADDRCIDIQQVALAGVTLLKPAVQAVLIAPYQKQCLTVAQINQLLQDITHAYIERGYVTTRAYLPAQDLGGGQLHIQVMEGRVEALDGAGVLLPQELRMVLPLHVGEAFNIRSLEQAVDQLGRLPSRQVQFDLQPGEEAGGSRVVARGERSKPWRVGLSRHNDGQRSTGEQQWSSWLAWDSPLGLADQLNIRGSRDAVSDRYRHSASHGLSYQLPYGWWTFNYHYNHSYYRTRTEGQGFSFVLDGVSTTQALTAERVIHRDSTSKTAVNVGISHIRGRNYLDNYRLDVSSQRLTEYQLGFNHGRRIGNAFLNLDLGWQRGSGALDAQRKGSSKGWQPVARYNKYTLTASYLQPFQLAGERFSFDSLFNAQRSEDVLYSPQRFSLGGLYSIRGYKDQSLTGDSGYYWRNQLRWSRPVTWHGLQPLLQQYSLLAAYDLGAIRGDKYNHESSGRMASHAIELSAQGEHLALSITSAHTLSRPDALERKERPVYFRIDVFF
ncbi:MAG: ShlB/FhaC/HecB family hemolysin secretion/activation protein [Thiopseudomonas sp.]|nr:ShlB/FhaC/HecB family hemolysin secretion/activation protein [Thiopseudomonas sp.]MCK9465447.1 ShlB/FhaC/HecB family hemolysin secretion/activation protein [Thiopseudomonas sp.]